MAFDANKTAAEVVQLVGGTENISSVAHCMTRLRFVVKNSELGERRVPSQGNRLNSQNRRLSRCSYARAEL